MKKLLVVLLAGVLLSGVASASGQAANDRYRLRAGDTVDLQYRLTPEFNQEVVVGPDGYVNLMIAGDVKIGGQTIAEAHDSIVKLDSVRLNEPELNVILKDFEKPFVVVSGEVYTPGKVAVRQDMTALQAIMMAGGFKETARETQVLLYRRINQDSNIAEVHELKLHRIRKKIELQNDMRLEPGDMILIPINRLEQFHRFVMINPVGWGFNLATL
jgi:polysaccharide export outer membrane protein